MSLPNKIWWNKMTSGNLGNLSDRLHQLARTPNILVACDYDGTLAPLVDDPMAARPNRSSVAALRQLAEMPNSHVAVISGRSLRDLATLSRFPEEIRLIGSHGSEFELGFASKLNPDLIRLRTAVTEQVQILAKKYGAVSEEKPTGVTFHSRNLDEETTETARAELATIMTGFPDVHVNHGHDVLEMSVIDTNKGTAIDQVRSQVGASAVLFIGDDVTDEDGFAVLAGPDVGIKVGPAKTVAKFRVASTDTVAEILALVAEQRANWLRGSGLTAIEDHSLLSDLRTTALVAPDSNITWMCAPRIDSTSIFADLLGGPAGGYFRIKPTDGSDALHQRYLSTSMAVETQFSEFSVTDILDVSDGRSHRLAGRTDLLRTVEGTGSFEVEFAPRANFGRTPTFLESSENGIVVKDHPDLLVLRSEGVDWKIVQDGTHHVAIGTAELHNSTTVLELRCGTSSLEQAAKSGADRLGESSEFWSQWVESLSIPPLEETNVVRSALTLKALSHGPTGAIVSAATTSLPEHLGGIRNWDHRYCWMRDAAFSATSLARLGSYDEALSYLDWVLRVLDQRVEPDRFSPVYNVTGHHLPPEAEIAELPGYGSSRPVRIGNAAGDQFQSDIFGPIVNLMAVLLDRGQKLSSEHWRLTEASVLAVSRRWSEPDHGIWQIRTGPRHHVYTKVMCWVAVDRAIGIADGFTDRPPQAWLDLRDEIAEDVLDKGWKSSIDSFSASYENEDLDASVLAIGLYGLVSAEDPRYVSTVTTIAKRLRSGPTVYRYLADDGLPGKEGGVHMMTAWLVEALGLIGQADKARELFSQLCELTGATGLLSEQYDPSNERALGNVPQAISHAGLIDGAVFLSQLD